MSTWSKLTVAELEIRGEASLQTGPFGTQLKASDYTEEGIPVINVRNIGFGDVRKADLEYLGESKAEALHQHHLKKGDIVFGRKGAVERHALIDDATHGWIQGSDCLRLRINSPAVSERYLSYYLKTQAHQDWMQALCAFGATMASLNQDIVRRISFPAPARGVQEKIAAILSSYDELIENNRRRIALLEKMAEEIYREWFVRMRFPGYVAAKFSKGLPETWKAEPSSEVFDVLSGGTPKTDMAIFWDGEIPFFTPKDAAESFFVLDTEKKITEKGLESCNSPLYPKGTIFITARGTVGKLALAYRPMAMNQSCYALAPKMPDSGCFHFLAIRNAIAYVKGVAKSGVFDNIVIDTFNTVPILMPDSDLIKRFDKLIQPLFDEMGTLLACNEGLIATRDVLLPRLISGKLAVEALDIQFPPSMQPA